MKVELIRSGRLDVDFTRAAEAVPPFVIGAIARRVRQGRDIHDRPFAPYSSSYREALEVAGYDARVDLNLTGGLMRALHLAESRVTGDRLELAFGLRATSSPSVSLGKGGAKRRRGRRGPPHGSLGYWLHHGTATMPARPWLGLSPADRIRLRQLLAQQRIFIPRPLK